jgi:hypothetical protein
MSGPCLGASVPVPGPPSVPVWVCLCVSVRVWARLCDDLGRLGNEWWGPLCHGGAPRLRRVACSCVASLRPQQRSRKPLVRQRRSATRATQHTFATTATRLRRSTHLRKRTLVASVRVRVLVRPRPRPRAPTLTRFTSAARVPRAELAAAARAVWDLSPSNAKVPIAVNKMSLFCKRKVPKRTARNALDGGARALE